MKKLKLKRSILSIILTMILIMNSVVVPVYASSVVSYNSRNTFKISSANDFPENIEQGQVYVLTTDITLNQGQPLRRSADSTG